MIVYRALSLRNCCHWQLHDVNCSFSRDICCHEGAGERQYHALYEDMVAHQRMWMDFFDVKDNYRHAENTCGILVRARAELFSTPLPSTHRAPMSALSSL
jgi:hypothetical protein